MLTTLFVIYLEKYVKKINRKVHNEEPAEIFDANIDIHVLHDCKVVTPFLSLL